MVDVVFLVAFLGLVVLLFLLLGFVDRQNNNDDNSNNNINKDCTSLFVIRDVIIRENTHVDTHTNIWEDLQADKQA